MTMTLTTERRKPLDIGIDFVIGQDTYADCLVRLRALQATRSDGIGGSDCHHPAKTMRVRVCSNKSRQYAYQCDVCGRQVGDNLPQPPLDERINLPTWDKDIQNAYWKARPNFFEVCRQEEADLFDRFHDAYMNSRQWKAIREKVLSRADGICEGCARRSAVHAHHKTYNHLGDELLFELVALCGPCHAKVHGRLRNSDI